MDWRWVDSAAGRERAGICAVVWLDPDDEGRVFRIELLRRGKMVEPHVETGVLVRALAGVDLSLRTSTLEAL